MKLFSPVTALFDKLSVFLKVTLLIVGTTLIVATMLTVESHRLVTKSIQEGLSQLASEMTSSTAANASGAIRFGDTESLQSILDTTMDRAGGQALYAVALNKAGETIGISGAAPSATPEIEVLAKQALDSGEAAKSENGYIIAEPARSGKDGSKIAGSVAIIWSPDQALAQAQAANMLSIATAGVVFLVMCTLCAWVIRTVVSHPLQDVREVVRDIAEGRYDTPAKHVERGDEIGGISRTVEGLKVQLAEAHEVEREQRLAQKEQDRVVEALTAALQRLAEGDLTHPIDQRFSAGYEPLRENYNNTLVTLVSIMQAVVENSHRIRSSSKEIGDSSTSLASRTESQASTLEQTASAMEELTASVRAAAEGAKDVETIVAGTKQTVQSSGEVVKQAVDAMSLIQASSDKISQIISVIDDISFQTNLLALNAGVEAARAGDAGRGFAVVASEVRALAQRSSDSASEIKELINESATHVDEGVTLVGRTGDELTKIISGVATVSERVSGIADGAERQATTLTGINKGVSELDRVTQQNAAMVEETAAASTVLHSDASELASQVSVFKVTSDDTGRRTSRAA
ncbi:methyl-accepting chemotaxis protein [uncultured Shimia sp.]|uniref:methyl-accepting chemotaxis protein n=1 Tax=uncultured Shimia sp. TaxID=573152 RepID=UPI0025D59C8C|nr:methyl-accepting chemotaxis protein [uncultured Shimia sp.]